MADAKSSKKCFVTTTKTAPFIKAQRKFVKGRGIDLTNMEKDEICAAIGKQTPPSKEYEQSIPVMVALDWCLREMGIEGGSKNA